MLRNWDKYIFCNIYKTSQGPQDWHQVKLLEKSTFSLSVSHAARQGLGDLWALMSIFLLVTGVAGADLTRPRELFLSGGGGAAGRQGRGGVFSCLGYFLYWVSIFLCISLISSVGGAGLSGSSSVCPEVGAPDILDWLLETEAGSCTWGGGGGRGSGRGGSPGGSRGSSPSSGGGGGRGGDRGGGAGLVRQLRMSERDLVMSWQFELVIFTSYHILNSEPLLQSWDLRNFCYYCYRTAVEKNLDLLYHHFLSLPCKTPENHQTLSTLR